MPCDSRENERKSLYRQLKYCGDLLAALKRASSIQIPYNDWYGLIEHFKKRGYENGEVDEIIRSIIRIGRDHNDNRWITILIAILWPTLISVYTKGLHYDFLRPDDLWQNIHWFFIRSIYNTDLEDQDYPVAIKIYYKIRGFVRDAYKSEWSYQKHFLDIDETYLEDFIDKKYATEMRIRKWISRLHDFQRKGIISEIDYHLIVDNLIYEESLHDCAFDLGLTYENAKKHRQRALKKIRDSLRRLSPNAQFDPLLEGRRELK